MKRTLSIIISVMLMLSLFGSFAFADSSAPAKIIISSTKGHHINIYSSQIYANGELYDHSGAFAIEGENDMYIIVEEGVECDIDFHNFTAEYTQNYYGIEVKNRACANLTFYGINVIDSPLSALSTMGGGVITIDVAKNSSVVLKADSYGIATRGDNITLANGDPLPAPDQNGDITITNGTPTACEHTYEPFDDLNCKVICGSQVMSAPHDIVYQKTENGHSLICTTCGGNLGEKDHTIYTKGDETGCYTYCDYCDYKTEKVPHLKTDYTMYDSEHCILLCQYCGYADEQTDIVKHKFETKKFAATDIESAHSISKCENCAYYQKEYVEGESIKIVCGEEDNYDWEGIALLICKDGVPLTLARYYNLIGEYRLPYDKDSVYDFFWLNDMSEYTYPTLEIYFPDSDEPVFDDDELETDLEVCDTMRHLYSHGAADYEEFYDLLYYELPDSLEYYTEASVKALADELKKVDLYLHKNKQSEVDAMTKRVSDAIDALVATDEPTTFGYLTLKNSVEIYKDGDTVGYYNYASDEFYPYAGGYTVLGYLNNNAFIQVDGVDTDITSVNTFVTGEYGSLSILGDSDVKLTAIGSNAFVSPFESYAAGIDVDENASLTITEDSDVLIAVGDEGCAGIGSCDDHDAGNITIDGGVVFAIGVNDAAGIGGGYKYSFNNITINGGRVYAECISDDGAGIGNGDDGIGGDIVINGGDITAYSLDDDGAGIGGADEGYINSITINGGVIHAASDDAAAIGGGSSSDSFGGKIIINGGLIIEDYIDSSKAFIGNDYDNDADASDNNFVQINGGNFISDGLIFPDPYNKNGKKLEKKTLTVADKLANSDVTLTLANGTKYTAPAYGKKLCVYLPIDTAVSNQKYLETGDITKVFNDVKSGRWYINAVEYNYVNGFISGMSATEFGVSTPVTRGMFITVLARIAGVDTSNNNVKTKFTDVESGRYYTGAIKWASDNKIVAGMTDTTFEPNSALQRQQLCVMIVNFAKHLKVELKPAEAAITFADASGIGNYAKTAVAACQTADIVNGYNEGGKIFFKPTNTATRAEAAQILYKFHSDFCK